MSLQINECSVIVGDLPKVLDFRKHELTAAIEESLHIIDNDNVEVIYFPDIAPSLYSVVIENLPNLKEVHVSGDVLWLRCVNLPKLNTLDTGGNLKWLLLDGLKTIKTIDLVSCHDLDLLWIEDLPSLELLNIKDLKKLREVQSLPQSQAIALSVQANIDENQTQSRGKVEIYENMTFSDIDLVLNTINLGAKIAADQGLIEDYSDPFSFEIRLINPLESLGTGGTGERYAYEFSAGHKESGGSFSLSLSEGHHNHEACLVRSLEFIADFLEVPNRDHPSTDDMLDYLYNLSKLNQ